MDMSELWVITYSIPLVNIANPARPVSEAAVKFKVVLHAPTKKGGQIPPQFPQVRFAYVLGGLRLKQSARKLSSYSTGEDRKTRV